MSKRCIICGRFVGLNKKCCYFLPIQKNKVIKQCFKLPANKKIRLYTKAQELAFKIRNESWEKNKIAPNWVNLEKTDLDQFFTHPQVAKECLASLVEFLKNKNINMDQFTFIEPSAGVGSFYELLPQDRRIGIDVEKFKENYIQKDFLDWTPSDNNKKYICIGNPPFGYRAWLALAFINHAAQFSDYVAFILPMSFQSEGKGTPKNRVKGFRLAHSSILDPEGFINNEGKIIKINALWQIWERDNGVEKEKIKTCSKYIDLFTMDINKNRLCGQKRQHEADIFLQRTFFGDPPKLVKDFNNVNYGCGYGIVIKRNKKEIKEILNSTDWIEYSSLAAHNARHISMHHIKKTITDAGFVDE